MWSRDRRVYLWFHTSTFVQDDNLKQFDWLGICWGGRLNGWVLSYWIYLFIVCSDGPAAAYIAATRPTESHTDLLCIPLDVNPTPSFVWRVRGTGSVLGTDQMLSGVEVSNFHDGNVIECTVTNSENNGKAATAFVDLEALRLNRKLVCCEFVCLCVLVPGCLCECVCT